MTTTLADRRRWHLKPSESESLPIPSGTGKTNFLGLGEKEFFGSVTTNPLSASASRQDYRKAVKEAMRAESVRRGGKFKPSPDYPTMDDFFNAILQTYEQVLAVGWMGNAPPEEAARIIIESLGKHD